MHVLPADTMRLRQASQVGKKGTDQEVGTTPEAWLDNYLDTTPPFVDLGSTYNIWAPYGFNSGTSPAAAEARDLALRGTNPHTPESRDATLLGGGTIPGAPDESLHNRNWDGTRYVDYPWYGRGWLSSAHGKHIHWAPSDYTSHFNNWTSKHVTPGVRSNHSWGSAVDLTGVTYDVTPNDLGPATFADMAKQATVVVNILGDFGSKLFAGMAELSNSFIDSLEALARAYAFKPVKDWGSVRTIETMEGQEEVSNYEEPMLMTLDRGDLVPNKMTLTCEWENWRDGVKRSSLTLVSVDDEGWMKCNCSEYNKPPTKHWCSHLNVMFKGNYDSPLAESASEILVPISPAADCFIPLKLKDVPSAKGMREVIWQVTPPEQSTLVNCVLGYHAKGEGVSALRTMFVDWFRSMRTDQDLFHQKCGYANHTGFIKTPAGQKVLKPDFVDALIMASTGYCSACGTLDDATDAADSLVF